VFIVKTPNKIGENIFLKLQYCSQISEKTVATNDFRKKHGQLLYLENLRKSEYGRNGGGENPEPCPICQRSLGSQWSVMQVKNKDFTRIDVMAKMSEGPLERKCQTNFCAFIFFNSMESIKF
jgi:E3 ubiquitin-protein ligase SHPRH